MCTALTAYSKICRRVRDWRVNMSILKLIRSVILGAKREKKHKTILATRNTEIILFNEETVFEVIVVPTRNPQDGIKKRSWDSTIHVS